MKEKAYGDEPLNEWIYEGEDLLGYHFGPDADDATKCLLHPDFLALAARHKKRVEQAESSAYERVVEVLAGMKQVIVCSPSNNHTLGEHKELFTRKEGFNSALSEAISKIKELKGKI